MSISVPLNKFLRNRYLLAAAFCAVFAGVYEAFSHGVVSPWMLALPVYPLAGALVFHILYKQSIPADSWFRALWLCGVATMAVCSCLRGVFEIYGTDFPFFWVLWVTGNLLAVAAQFCQKRRKTNIVSR